MNALTTDQLHYYPILPKFGKLRHKRLSNFLEKSKLIYSLQFRFRQNYSISYALIHLTETIKQSLDQGLFSCGIFVDLQKAFDTVDHGILLAKLEHYGIRDITNKLFQTYLKDRQQFLSINGCNSECASWCSTRVRFGSSTIPFVH